MKQILNIFRKDMRQLWIEILAANAALLVVTLREPPSWWFQHDQRGGIVPIFLTFTALLSIAWAVLILRLGQSDRMVGLNQFWTTRPYEWSHLLAAKGLFLLAFLYAPLWIAQVWLLHRANLPVVANLLHLVLNTISLTAVAFLPLFCIATITSSFAKSFFTTLAMSGFVIGLGMWIDIHVRHQLDFHASEWAALLMTAFAVAAVVSQYSQRKTKRSVILFLVAYPVVLIMISICIVTNVAAMDYDAPKDGMSARIVTDVPQHLGFDKSEPNPNASLIVDIPLAITGGDAGASGTHFFTDGTRLTLRASNGAHWTSGWEGYGAELGANSFVKISISRADFDRLGDGLVTARLEIATRELKDQPAWRSTVPDATTVRDVPNLGVCRNITRDGTLVCASSIGPSPIFAVKTLRQIGPCGDPATPAKEATWRIGGPYGGINHGIHVSPVLMDMPLVMMRSEMSPSRVCPGTPLTVVETRFSRQLRLETPEVQIPLNRYVFDETKHHDEN